MCSSLLLDSRGALQDSLRLTGIVPTCLPKYSPTDGATLRLRRHQFRWFYCTNALTKFTSRSTLLVCFRTRFHGWHVRTM